MTKRSKKQNADGENKNIGQTPAVDQQNVRQTPFSSEQSSATRPKQLAKAPNVSKLRQLADVTIFDSIFQSGIQETDMLQRETLPKKSKKKDVTGKSVRSTPSNPEQCNEIHGNKSTASSISKPLEQPEGIAMFDPITQTRIQETNKIPSEKLPKKPKKDVSGKGVRPSVSMPEQCNENHENKATSASATQPLKQQAGITDPILQPGIQETKKLQSEKLPKKSKKDVSGKSVRPTTSLQGQCNESQENKATASSTSKHQVQQQSQKKKENLFKISSLIETEGLKYNLLYTTMTKDIKNLAQGYKCLQSFRTSELWEKSKGSPACIKPFCIGKVKFVMRKQFNKIPADDAITPKRFASVLSVAADKVFREQLVSDPAAMKMAFKTIQNPFGRAHGFSVNDVPETEEQKKLFYYYLVTTISMNSLMEINPISCMAIAKWRLEDNNFKRLGLHNKAMDIDEMYARCLSDIRATTKYVMKNKNSCFVFKPDDVIDDQVVMKKIMSEFLFLKKYAAKPFTKRFQFCS